MLHPDPLVWLVVWPPPHPPSGGLTPAAEVIDCNGFTAVPLTGHCLDNRKMSLPRLSCYKGMLRANDYIERPSPLALIWETSVVPASGLPVGSCRPPLEPPLFLLPLCSLASLTSLQVHLLGHPVTPIHHLHAALHCGEPFQELSLIDIIADFFEVISLFQEETEVMETVAVVSKRWWHMDILKTMKGSFSGGVTPNLKIAFMGRWSTEVPKEMGVRWHQRAGKLKEMKNSTKI